MTVKEFIGTLESSDRLRMISSIVTAVPGEGAQTPCAAGTLPRVDRAFGLVERNWRFLNSILRHGAV